jgi:hypothetical protein
MWDVALPVVGQCPHCGEDLSRTVHLRATPEWIARYRGDERLRRGIDNSVARRVLERHGRQCVGLKRQRAAAALVATA